jgi:hypothetical protein
LACALACGAVVAQLTGFAHLALVPHSVCAEHGELIHSEHGSSAVPSPAPVAAGQALVSAAHQSEGAHSHDHCASVAARRERAVPARSITVTVCASAELQSFALVSGLGPTAVKPVFGYAPKCSPPV